MTNVWSMSPPGILHRQDELDKLQATAEQRYPPFVYVPHHSPAGPPLMLGRLVYWGSGPRGGNACLHGKDMIIVARYQESLR